VQQHKTKNRLKSNSKFFKMQPSQQQKAQ
ncbi:uncharacterized protein METZ01_LOCUS37054, partial [marine metagenome]